jgi:SAM-dependent methyltransferase
VAGIPELRDRAVEVEVAEVLRDHRLLADLQLRVLLKGGVAHIQGEVVSPITRNLVRQVVGRVRGVHAVWDDIVVGKREDVIVDLGCGSKKQRQRAIGVDRHVYSAVDLIANLEQPLPLAQGSVDQVFAVHVLEHVSDLPGLLTEIHGILRPGGVLHVMVPDWRFVNAVADPTHVRFFSTQTFKYFCCPHSGMPLFRPLAVAGLEDHVLADLQPVKDGEPPASPLELVKFFD